MSAANLDEIKRKYNFKEISVATWRDPSLSVHPVRGGPDSPSFSANASYVPTYKANYESTDDEDSGGEGDDEGHRDEASIDPGLEEPLDELPEPEHRPDTPIEDRFETETAPELENQVAESERIDEKNLDSTEADVEHNLAKDDDLQENDLPIDMPEEGVQSPEAADTAPIDVDPFGDAAEGDAAPPSDTGSDERRVSFAPGTPDPKPTPRKKKAATGTKKKKKRIAVPIDSLPADVMAMIDGAFEGLPPPPPPPPAPEPPIEDDFILDDATPKLEHRDETIDQDAAPLEEPSSEVAPAPRASNGPVSGNDDGLPTEPPTEPLQEEPLDIQEAEQIAEPAIEPAESEESQPDVHAAEPVEETPAPTEKPSKKKSSTSGKDKGKSKKKSSKTKSRDISPPPTGLGIDLPPPPPAPAIEDAIDEAPALASADHQETTTEELPAGDLEKASEETLNGDLGPESDHQEAPAAEDVPESAVDEPIASDLTTDQPEETPEGAKDLKQDPGVADDTTEPDHAAERKEGEADAVPNAWDETETVAESSAAPVDAKDEAEGEESAPADSAPSPVDSGVEFEDDSAKAADDETGVEDSGPAEEAEAVADHGEAADAGASATESGDNNEERSEQDSAVQASDAAEDPSTSEAAEAEGEGTRPNASEPAAEEAAGDIEPKGNADAEALETLAEDVKADEVSADPPIEVVPDEAPPHESSEGEPYGDAADGTEVPAADVDDEVKDAVAEGETAVYEPPTVESVSEEAKVDPFEFEVVAEPNEPTGAELEQETIREVESSSEAPPSPVLSKNDSQGSHKHKADHWARKHADNPLKEVFEDAKVLERTHSSKSGKDELRVRDRHRKSRRMSSSGEDEGERRRRRAARKEAERKEAEAARLSEELKRRAEDERKHQERRAAKQRAVERSAAQKDIDTRQRSRERDVDRSEGRSTRPLKATLPFALPGIPKALNLTSGESVHGASVVRSHGGAYKPAAKDSTRAVAPTSAPRDEVDLKPVLRDAKTASPPSSGGEKSPHRHRHRRHRSDGDRSSRNGKESDRHHRRPQLVEEKVEARPRSFLGFVKI